MAISMHSYTSEVSPNLSESFTREPNSKAEIEDELGHNILSYIKARETMKARRMR